MKYKALPHKIYFNKVFNSYCMANSINYDDIFNSIINQKENSLKSFDDILNLLKSSKNDNSHTTDIKQINFHSFKKHLTILDNFLKLIDEYIQILVVRTI